MTDRTIPPLARKRIERYQAAFEASAGKPVAVTYRNGFFYVRNSIGNGSTPYRGSKLDEMSAVLERRVAERAAAPEPAEEQRIRTSGKQLLLDGVHLADARDPEAAEVIAICLNRANARHMTDTEDRKVTEFFA